MHIHIQIGYGHDVKAKLTHQTLKNVNIGVNRCSQKATTGGVCDNNLMTQEATYGIIGCCGT